MKKLLQVLGLIFGGILYALLGGFIYFVALFLLQDYDTPNLALQDISGWVGVYIKIYYLLNLRIFQGLYSIIWIFILLFPLRKYLLTFFGSTKLIWTYGVLLFIATYSVIFVLQSVLGMIAI